VFGAIARKGLGRARGCSAGITWSMRSGRVLSMLPTTDHEHR
jgi:hypothetical protein